MIFDQEAVHPSCYESLMRDDKTLVLYGLRQGSREEESRHTLKVKRIAFISYCMIQLR
jgi:hypothetical protein